MRQLVQINDKLFVFFSLDFMAAMKVETFQSKGQLLICIRILIIILIIEPHNNKLCFSAIENCTTTLIIEIITSITDPETRHAIPLSCLITCSKINVKNLDVDIIKEDYESQKKKW